MVIPPPAFVGWTAAERTSAFYAVWSSTGAGARDAIVIPGAVALGLLATILPVTLNKAQAKA